jgi:AraC family transcriptional regulator, alkane utilization regulator
MTVSPDLLPETPRTLPQALIEEALKLVHLSSAFFLRGEFAAPWSFASMGPQDYAALVPGASRLVLFHVVLEGRCRIRVESGEEAIFSEGEAVVLPYCDRHTMSDPDGRARTTPISQLLPPQPWSAMPVMSHGGDGSRTRVLCGYLNCEDLLFQPLLRALPPLIHVKPASGPAAEWLRASARYTLSEPAGRSRLSELLLVDSLRQYLERLPQRRKGWLAALRDPVVGRAMTLLHESPAHPWNVPQLAKKVGVSRTVLGERFAASLGEPPMKYLARWRLQLASNLLRRTRETLGSISSRVGYKSEAAFSRAFKRGIGESPAAFRASRRRS